MILIDQLMRYMIFKIKIYAQQDAIISLICKVTVLGNALPQTNKQYVFLSID